MKKLSKLTFMVALAFALSLLISLPSKRRKKLLLNLHQMKKYIVLIFLCFAIVGGCGGANESGDVVKTEAENGGLAKYWFPFIDCLVEEDIITKEQSDSLIQPIEIIFDEPVTCNGPTLANGCLPEPTVIHYFQEALEPFVPFLSDVKLRCHEYFHSLIWQLNLFGDEHPKGDTDHKHPLWQLSNNRCLSGEIQMPQSLLE